MIYSAHLYVKLPLLAQKSRHLTNALDMSHLALIPCLIFGAGCQEQGRPGVPGMPTELQACQDVLQVLLRGGGGSILHHIQ